METLILLKSYLLREICIHQESLLIKNGVPHVVAGNGEKGNRIYYSNRLSGKWKEPLIVFDKSKIKAQKNQTILMWPLILMEPFLCLVRQTLQISINRPLHESKMQLQNLRSFIGKRFRKYTINDTKR